MFLKYRNKYSSNYDAPQSENELHENENRGKNGRNGEIELRNKKEEIKIR